MPIVVTIPGPPRGKQRPRMTRQGHAYTPAQTVNAEAWVRHCAVEQVGQLCLETALALDVDVRLPIPASWSKAKRAQAASGSLQPGGKPDIDNYAKLAMDSLNGVLWRDDSQITTLTARKRYGDAPGMTLTVTAA